MRASEINRLHKILDDGGIKLGGVVSDMDGVSARAMVGALIAGRPVEQILDLAKGRLKQRRDELRDSLEGDLSARHVFVLGHIEAHIRALQSQLAEIDAYLLDAMQPCTWAHQLLQTIPGTDAIAAALILIEIGDDMARFGRPDSLACWAALSPGNNESAGKRKNRAAPATATRSSDRSCANAPMRPERPGARWRRNTAA